MKIDKNGITLTEDTYAYIYRTSEQKIFETFRDNLKKYINIINDLVNQDFKKLSDDDFYDLLCKVYSITLTEEDYLKIISKRNNKSYNKFIEIGTFMTFTGTATEGHGRNFDFWKQLYQVRYVAAVSEDIDIKPDCFLKKEDIKELIQNKSIVIVGIKSIPLNNRLELNEKVEEMPSINLNMDGSIYKDDNFAIITSMLRKYFTKKRIFENMKAYIEELQKEMKVILSHSQPGYAEKEVSKLCNEWYEKSELKEQFKGLQIKLNNKQL